jgi:hypothetical protein
VTARTLYWREARTGLDVRVGGQRDAV